MENQINRLADKFNEIEENLDDSVIEKEEFYDIEELAEKPFEMDEPNEEIPPTRKKTKRKKRRTKAEPLEN